MREEQIIVGGQAVMEGVMMRAPHSYAVAVRRADGQIVTKAELAPYPAQRYPLLKLPVLRGAGVLIQSMTIGIKALNFSTSVLYEDAVKAEQQAAESPEGENSASAGDSDDTLVVELKPKDAKAEMPKAAAFGSIAFALVVNVVLFIMLPLLITNVLFVYLGNGSIHGKATTGAWYAQAFSWLRAALKPIRPTVAFNLVDGVIRMSFFLLMIWTMSLLNEMRRVFEYHGAEHKVVFTWEAGEELTVENARRKPRQHPRCGTSFLMLVMLVAIVMFSVVRFDSLLLNLATRILLIPVIAGISYEIIRASARGGAQSLLSIITRPGLWLQNITTKEPDDSQLEVSITALKESLKLEPAGERELAA
ncbi:MAG TPA: DUF1385 domain-containing protein [Blastocatellia bacterium]|nr:DUF1385 domain-containing protein [Blastocatellia bacterium]